MNRAAANDGRVDVLFRRHVKGAIAAVYDTAFDAVVEMAEAERPAILDEVHRRARLLTSAAKEPLADASKCRAELESLFRLVGGDYETYCRDNGTDGGNVVWSSDDDA